MREIDFLLTKCLTSNNSTNWPFLVEIPLAFLALCTLKKCHMWRALKPLCNFIVPYEWSNVFGLWLTFCCCFFRTKFEKGLEDNYFWSSQWMLWNKLSFHHRRASPQKFAARFLVVRPISTKWLYIEANLSSNLGVFFYFKVNSEIIITNLTSNDLWTWMWPPSAS